MLEYITLLIIVLTFILIKAEYKVLTLYSALINIKAETLHSEYYSEELDTPKYLLRKLSYKYLPKEIIERKKMGFPVPLTDWFENLEEIARDLLTDVTWLKKGVIEDLIKKSKLEARSGQILWMFVNIELFKKIYFQKNWKWEN